MTTLYPRSTHSVSGIDLHGYKNIESYCAAKWAKADPARRKKQQRDYYLKNKQRLIESAKQRYQRRKARAILLARQIPVAPPIPENLQ